MGGVIMKHKLELLEIADSLYFSSDENKFYEFAKNYILHMKVKGISETDEFFNAIELIRTNPESDSIRYALGFAGKGDKNIVTVWSSCIVNNKDLRSLTLDELHYVIGYANRKSKVKETSNSETQTKKDDSSLKKTIRPKRNKRNHGVKLPAADETLLKCKKCGETFIVKLGKPYSYYRDATCTQCNAKFRYKY